MTINNEDAGTQLHVRLQNTDVIMNCFLSPSTQHYKGKCQSGTSSNVKQEKKTKQNTHIKPQKFNLVSVATTTCNKMG